MCACLCVNPHLACKAGGWFMILTTITQKIRSLLNMQVIYLFRKMRVGRDMGKLLWKKFLGFI